VARVRGRAGLNDAFNKDTFPQKMNLGVGAYRDDNGKVRGCPATPANCIIGVATICFAKRMVCFGQAKNLCVLAKHLI
jgi:hypothetical protein